MYTSFGQFITPAAVKLITKALTVLRDRKASRNSSIEEAPEVMKFLLMASDFMTVNFNYCDEHRAEDIPGLTTKISTSLISGAMAIFAEYWDEDQRSIAKAQTHGEFEGAVVQAYMCVCVEAFLFRLLCGTANRDVKRDGK